MAVPHRGCRRKVSRWQGSSPPLPPTGAPGPPGSALAASWDISRLRQMKESFLTRRLMYLIHHPQGYHLSY